MVAALVAVVVGLCAPVSADAHERSERSGASAASTWLIPGVYRSVSRYLRHRQTPPGHWNRIGLDLIDDDRLGARHAALALAALNTAQADAFIACWSAKFTFWTKRPVTLIRELLDPGYLSLIPTPPFPSYPSGHSTTSGAAATVLGALFPDRASEVAAMADEAAISRLYGGIHYRFDNDAGLSLGQRIGSVTLRKLERRKPGAAVAA
jgi:membrane-associated phospholipid phosphatase